MQLTILALQYWQRKITELWSFQLSCKNLYIESNIIKRKRKQKKCKTVSLPALCGLIHCTFHLYSNTFNLFSLLCTFAVQYNALTVRTCPAAFPVFWPGWRQGLCAYTWQLTAGVKGQQKPTAWLSNKHPQAQLSEAIQYNAPEPPNKQSLEVETFEGDKGSCLKPCSSHLAVFPLQHVTAMPFAVLFRCSSSNCQIFWLICLMKGENKLE